MPALPLWNYWTYLDDEHSGTDGAENDGETFHNGMYNADFAKWSRRQFWTANEAAALSFGKAPEDISYESLDDIGRGPSHFAEFFEILYNMILEAQKSFELPTSISPHLYFDWAKRNGVDLPDDLLTEVARHQQNYEEILQQNETLLAEIESLKSENRKLQYQVEKASGAPKEVKQQSAERSQSGMTLQLKTLKKMIIGMAVSKYRYKKGSNKQSATKNIADDLQREGLQIDEDTVRQKLSDAAELLP